MHAIPVISTLCIKGEIVKYILAAALIVTSSGLYAQDVHSLSSTTIKHISVHSNTDALTSEWSGVSVVYPEGSINWNTETNCTGNLVLVKKDDKHILSTLLAAQAAQKLVKYYAFSTVNIGGTYCFARAIRIDT
mgnify:CR=1 FL=1